MATSSFNDYDIIVIGSGIGGLVCATKLARQGLRVAVFEQYYKPGGYCTDFTRKGFRFDAAVHFIGGCQGGGIIGNILDDLGLTSDIEFVRVDPIFRVVTQEDDFRLPGDLNEFFIYLKLRFPAERAGLEKFAELIRSAWNEIAALLEAPAEKTFSLSIKSQYVAKIITQTFQAILDDHFSSPNLKALLSIFCTYGGLPPSRMSGMYMIAILGSYLCQGTYYPYGGSQEFTNTLVRGLTKSGGILHLRRNVSKVLLSDNKVVGVKLENGDEVSSRYVVSNTDAFHLFNDLIGKDHISNRLNNQLNSSEISMSAFQVFLGVDMDLSSLGVYESEIILSPTLELIDDYDIIRNKKARNAGLGITIPSLLDSRSAPPNQHCVCLSLPVLSDAQVDWNLIKNEIADSLIMRAEEFLPGLRECLKSHNFANLRTINRIIAT